MHEFNNTLFYKVTWGFLCGCVQAGSFEAVKIEELRPLKQQDYLHAVTVVRPSVSQQTVEAMQAWGQGPE